MKRSTPLRRVERLSPAKVASQHRATLRRRKRLERRNLKDPRRWAFKSAVLARAGNRCERCGGLGPKIDGRRLLDAHHVLSRARGGPHEPWNGAALCGGADGCHLRAHAHLIPDWREWLAHDEAEARALRAALDRRGRS